MQKRFGTVAGTALLFVLCHGVDLFAQGPVQGGALPPLFPANNWWNVDVSAAPVDPGSAAFITWIGNDRLHPDFGGDADDPPSTDIYGMPYITVPGTQALERVTFVNWPGESDAGAPGRPLGYPIPVAARTQPKWIEGGEAGGGTDGDHHMLIVDRDNRILYELYQAHWNAGLSRWEAASGAIWSLDSNARRPATWTSADAAGLAILPGLIRYDEVFGPNPIRHALRFTTRGSNGHVFPGSHTAGSAGGALPMGARLRLKSSVVITGFPASMQKIFQAMKTYGLVLADNGSDMYIQGTYDTRWNNDILNPAFGALVASDFEVIQLGWQPTPADLIFRDGFESGGLAPWSTSVSDGGDLRVTPAAGLSGTALGLEAFVDDANSLYVQDDLPVDENRLRARFYFNPHTFDPGTMTGNLRVRIFLALKGSPLTRLLTIVLRLQAGQFAVMARVRRDNGTTADTPFVNIADGPHRLEVDWRRATDLGSGDGSLQMWVDGNSVATLSGITNGLRGVDTVRLGAMSVKPAASGALHFDQFESRRRTLIGP